MKDRLLMQEKRTPLNMAARAVLVLSNLEDCLQNLAKAWKVTAMQAIGGESRQWQSYGTHGGMTAHVSPPARFTMDTLVKFLESVPEKYLDGIKVQVLTHHAETKDLLTLDSIDLNHSRATALSGALRVMAQHSKHETPHRFTWCEVQTQRGEIMNPATLTGVRDTLFKGRDYVETPYPTHVTLFGPGTSKRNIRAFDFQV